MNEFDFSERLEWSKGKRLDDDIATLRSMLDGCVSVEPMEIREDKMGNDYRVILRRGGEILVDAKNRDRGCSRFWKCGPEFALEKWSVLPENGTPGKTGWTLCERKQTDLIFFKFYPEDSTDVFLVSYQLLRVAFRRNLNLWENQFQVARQSSGAWKSECVFVPASIVFCAINDISVSRLVEP